MKSVICIFLISIIVLAGLGGAGYWFLQNLSVKEEDRISDIAEEIAQEKETPETAEPEKAEGTEKPADVGMEEVQVQIYLHQMTHQKIIAAEKRGAVEMSLESIENMLTIVRRNKDIYEHSEFYEEALTAWENGDFQNAVSVHNTIWNWHNGTVGRATGLMSKEQEEEFVRKHFK